MKNFRDRVAAVTGAGSGIGRALALALAADGAELALSDIDEERVTETARMCSGARVTTRTLDVANRDAVFAWADEVVRDHGAAHMIFNNAGVSLAGSLSRVSMEDFHWLMNINFWGVVHGSLAFLPHLEREKEGHIVNVSSIFGIIAAPLNGTYNAAKFAVRGFTEALRIELQLDGSPIGVTCVHPGGIKTNIARSARMADDMKGRDIGSEFEKMARTTPDQCAKTILRAVRRNAPRVLVGADAHLIDTIQRIAPTGYPGIIARLTSRRWGQRTR